MKTPITYYGGKQNLLPEILPMIPKHTLYAEPFAGGLAVFFAKEPSKAEVINDLNNSVINFYRELKSNYEPLKRLVDATLHSREVYSEARIILSHPSLFDNTQRAWAFWVLSSQTFNSVIDNPFGYDRKGSCARRIRNKADDFTDAYSVRLRNTSVENIDAVELIRIYDAPDTFFYADPPYVGAEQGHYRGYEQEHFDKLLGALCKVKGKFLLSSYQNPRLTECIKDLGWHTKKLTLHLSTLIGKNKQPGRTKQEVFTWNYNLE